MSQYLFLHVKKCILFHCFYSYNILIKKYLINEVFRWALLFLENALPFHSKFKCHLRDKNTGFFSRLLKF